MLQIISPAHMKPITTPSRAASNLIKRQPTILKVHTDTSGRQAVLIAPKTGTQLPKNIATPSTTGNDNKDAELIVQERGIIQIHIDYSSTLL